MIDDIRAAVQQWLDVNEVTIRDAHSHEEQSRVVELLHKHMNAAGVSDEAMDEDAVDLEGEVAGRYMTLYPVQRH